MSGDANQYLEALRKMKDAEAVAENVANKIIAAGRAMQNWRQVSISNASFKFPPELILVPGKPTIDAREWPSVEIIGQALESYHAARLVAQGAYHSVPAENRELLPAPPKA